MRYTTKLAAGLTGLALVLSTISLLGASSRRPPKNPAKISIDVSPEAAQPGGHAVVTLTLDPIEGVKIARYPQIKLTVPAKKGLVAGAGAAIGSAKPPPPDKLATNYWKKVDPVVLTLALDKAAAAGSHEVEAKLRYNYCVSGDFCAPARVAVKIPLSVR